MDSEQAGALPGVANPSRVAQWLVPGWKRALKTISMLGAATAIGAVCVFLTQTLLARELGPDAYGLFASSLATVTMIAPLAGFGLTQFRLRVYGVEGWAAARWIKPSLRFTVGTTVTAMAIIVGWALAIAPPRRHALCDPGALTGRAQHPGHRPAEQPFPPRGSLRAHGVVAARHPGEPDDRRPSRCCSCRSSPGVSLP
jgi:hypothetical protein